MKIDTIIKLSLFMCTQVRLFATFYEGNTMSGLERKIAVTQGHDNNQEYISSLEDQIQKLTSLHQKIIALPTLEEKLTLVSSLPQVQQFLAENRSVRTQLQGLNARDEYVIKALIALGQGNVVFSGWKLVTDREALFANLVELLTTTEQFYGYMGGLIGYHLKTLELMRDQLAGDAVKDKDDVRFLPPPYVDVRKGGDTAAEMVVNGLNALESMAEIHVVGGAGERLRLIDENTGRSLPVAYLQFCGRPLLEGLIRDLEAREYLYYKLIGKQIRVPIVLMTSQDKNNDTLIADLCQKHNWFGRPKESIFQLLQPLVPVITIEGNWALKKPGTLVLKPGGHGVIWKLAQERGAFDWLQKQMKKFCLVRQINNPIAGLDQGL
ncbi:MAG: UTP--glucose-1-phosphate uridylyltransferase, partial [Verrucomicrobia bacterium]|nr:UTP--glucose-1-phosphate uridylyltransferase [Verrucomicrobiota bacterium]